MSCLMEREKKKKINQEWGANASHWLKVEATSNDKLALK